MAFSSLALLTIEQQIIPNLPQENFVDGHYDWVVAHSTDCVGDTPEGESNYFHQAWNRVQAFVHFFVGTTIVQNASLNFRAWGAGQTANAHAIHVELTEGEDFNSSYANYIALMAALLYDAKLGVQDAKTLWSHAEISNTFHQTDHQDPIAFLAQHGKTWANVVADVTSKYNEFAQLEAAYNQKNTVTAYRVYQGTKLITSFAYLDNAKTEANKYAGGYVRRSTDNAVVYTNSPAPDPVYNIKGKATNINEKDKATAYSDGWRAFNSGDTSVVLTDPQGSIYTFAKHTADNPVKPVQTEPTTPTTQTKTETVAVDLNTVTEVVNDASTAVTLLQKVIQLLKTLFRLG